MVAAEVAPRLEVFAPALLGLGLGGRGTTGGGTGGTASLSRRGGALDGLKRVDFLDSLGFAASGFFGEASAKL